MAFCNCRASSVCNFPAKRNQNSLSYQLASKNQQVNLQAMWFNTGIFPIYAIKIPIEKYLIYTLIWHVSFLDTSKTKINQLRWRFFPTPNPRPTRVVNLPHHHPRIWPGLRVKIQSIDGWSMPLPWNCVFSPWMDVDTTMDLPWIPMNLGAGDNLPPLEAP